MDITWIAIETTLAVFSIVGIGFFLRRRNIITTEIAQGLMNIAINVLFPCLILDKMLGSKVLTQPLVVISAAGMGFCTIMIGYGLCYLVGPLVGLQRGSGRRTFAVSSGLQNFGFVAIPLLAAFFPSEESMAVLFTHNVGVDVALWTVGLMLLSGTKKPSWQLLMKGPIIAVFFGLLLANIDAGSWMPNVISTILGDLGACTVPVCLLITGSTFSDLVGKEKFRMKVAAGSIIMRLAVLPLIMLSLARFLPISTELKQVMVIQASLPAAVTTIILSRYYGGQPGVAIQVVIATTLAALITMPLIITLGIQWLGL
ncbi:AEC family transporter [Persicirhabdus sediminis]|uniref:AEC family transporter n=1 Tax=Persicirhabdus sediminis TaxID=454144 RepID=A0A8J7MJB7_9BACT|nr:AEC family transporter [Persicirhabdus sediminis]MBK1792058.1 AEC family transporter [Persicirhabdus sediminis]